MTLEDKKINQEQGTLDWGATQPATDTKIYPFSAQETCRVGTLLFNPTLNNGAVETWHRWALSRTEEQTVHTGALTNRDESSWTKPEHESQG